MRKNPLKHNILFVSVISAFILYGSTNGNHVVNKNINNINHINNTNSYVRSDVCEILNQMRKQYIVKPKEKVIIKEENLFLVSAYDLSYQSTQKSRSSKGYGITASGFSLKGHTLQSARVIAGDPNIIPPRSKVRLKFKNDKYKQYDGIYFCLDQGGLIKGQKIDLFVGDNFWSSKKIKDFGVTECEVEIIKEDN